MSPVAALHEAMVLFNAGMLVYLLGLNSSYALLFFCGRLEVWGYVSRRVLRNYDLIATSELSMAVSILMPSYNEGPVIVESVRSMLELAYANFEVIVINDGSRDDTLQKLKEAYQLVAVDRVPRSRLDHKHVRRVYVSPTNERLLVIDKDNGGKADSLNAGLRYSRYPLFCAVDADTLLERASLPRLVWQFQADARTVAVGGIVRIVNGCSVAGGDVQEVRAPANMLVNLQIVEYLRAFLIGRTGWSRLGMLLIISGAFGMFRRDVVIEAGGYRTDTVGEDAELVVRLHRHCRESNRPYTVAFIADPVCWTQAPETREVLRRQRDRWQRGLLETLWRHRRMMLNPRYGRIGMVAMPYFFLFEAAGALIEATGLVVFCASLILGWVSGVLALLLLILALGYGLAFSLGALYLEERSFQRYTRRRDLVRLSVAAVVDNFGYRQWHTLVRLGACVSLMKKKHEWGEMTRIGFSASAPVPAAAGPAGLMPPPGAAAG